MRTLQILSLAAAVASFVAMILIGNSIAREVNDALGTAHNGIWRLNGNSVWKEHQRLFPANGKRVALAGSLIAAFGLLFVSGFIAP